MGSKLARAPELSRNALSQVLQCAGMALLVQVTAARCHADAPSDIPLEITGGPLGCVTAASVRARVNELMTGQAWPSELRVSLELEPSGPHFVVSKAGSPFAQRRFQQLPTRCAERRDAIAFAIVLAVAKARPTPGLFEPSTGSAEISMIDA